MEAVCISIVRNEADIIEAFVRYHVARFDLVVVIDHNSQDDTRRILDAMRQEGLPLEVRQESVAWHAQAECMTDLARDVWSKHHPHWIVPLDADEFLVQHRSFRELHLPAVEHVLFPVWHNYTPTDSDPQDDHVLKRIRFKNAAVNTNQHKVIIPGYLMAVPGTYLPEGNHELYYKDKTPVPYSITEDMHIAHFPVRSSDQVQKKAFVGWPSKLANPLNNGVAPAWSHWKFFFDKFRDGGKLSTEDLQALALGYTTDQTPGVMNIVEQPIEVTPGMELRYPPKPYLPLRALADTAEMLAFNFMISHHKRC